MDDTTPPAIAPRYRTGAPNASIVLATGPVTLRQGETSELVPDGSVKFVWLPLPGVLVTGRRPDFRLHDVGVEASAVSIQGGFSVERAGRSGAVAASDGDVYIYRSESRTPSLHCADLHVLNLPPMAGRTLAEVGTITPLGRQTWRFGEWRMTMDPIGMPRTLVTEAKDVRGNLLTHVVRVDRSDTAPFGAEQLAQVVDDLHLALSFVFGDEIGPVLAAGRSEQGDVVLELLRPYPCEGWRSRFGPAPRYSGIETMMEALGTILACPIEGVREAIVYYLEACHGMVEASVVLSQASLDRLAYHYLVTRHGILTPAAYDRRRSAENIRHVMQAMAIPTTLDGQPLDLPDLITRSRNQVHAGPRPNRVEALDVYRHALHIVELCILNLAGYQGVYHARGARHAIDEVMVPWAGK